MCSPDVMAKVADVLTRRRMLGQAGSIGVVAAGAALTTHRSALAQATPVATPVGGAFPGGFSSVVDLSHVWGADFPMFPGAAQPTFEVLTTVATGGFYKNLLTLDEHTGTHMDAPAHFTEDAPTAELLPVDGFFVPLAVVDISARAESDPDAQGMVEDIMDWETANGPLPPRSFVAMSSGWDSLVSDPDAYINVDDGGVAHFPGWHPEAAAFLVEDRDIVGAGVDTLSLDYGASTDFATHVTLLGAGKYGIENLKNLRSLPAVGASIFVGGPMHEAASGGPTRVLALI